MSHSANTKPMSRSAALIDGAIAPMLVRMTIPMIGGMFSVIAFNLVDTWFISMLGTDELAAIGFTFPVVMVFGGIAMGLGTAAGSLVSRAIGRNDGEQVARLTTDSLILAFLVVLVFVIAGLLTIDPLFTLLGAPAHILPLISDYMSVWYCGMAFLVIPMVGNNAIRATGDTKFPSFVMMGAALVNVVLDPILIFGLFGFPRMELAGAALSTVIARLVSLLLSLGILHFRERLLRLKNRDFRTMLASWKKLMIIGIPASATNIAAPVAVGIVTRLVASYGPEAVAALGTGVRIDGFALIVLMALGTVIVPMVGQNRGAKRFDRVRTTQDYCHLFAFIYGLAVAGLLWLAAEPVARIFSTEKAVVDKLVMYLEIVPLGFGLMGVCRLTGSSFNALNKPLHAAALSFVRMFVLFLPLTYGGAYLIGLRGIVGGIALTNILAGLIAIVWFNIVFERDKKNNGFIPREPNELETLACATQTDSAPG